MRKHIFIILILQGIANAFAQTGRLEVYLEGNYDNEVYTFELWKDSLIASQRSSDYIVEFESLNEGIYALRITSETYGMPTIYNEIEMKNDSTTEMEITVWRTSISCNSGDCDSCQNNRIEINIDLLYASVFDENTLPVKNGFHFNYGYTQWLPLHKNFNIGFSEGLYYNFNLLDTTFNNLSGKYTKQRYSNVGFSIEAKARIALFNTTKYWTFGPFLDFGAAYKFPFAFRHVQVGDDLKTTYKNLHNFKDVHAFVKLGYTPVSVMLDYRLFDFVKGDFPQQPKWSIGLSFVPEL
jgi:hypothetical protein